MNSKCLSDRVANVDSDFSLNSWKQKTPRQRHCIMSAWPDEDKEFHKILIKLMRAALELDAKALDFYSLTKYKRKQELTFCSCAPSGRAVSSNAGRYVQERAFSAMNRGRSSYKSGAQREQERIICSTQRHLEVFFSGMVAHPNGAIF